MNNNLERTLKEWYKTLDHLNIKDIHTAIKNGTIRGLEIENNENFDCQVRPSFTRALVIRIIRYVCMSALFRKNHHHFGHKLCTQQITSTTDSRHVKQRQRPPYLELVYALIYLSLFNPL